MYYEYFGLKQAPFKITPDTSLFFPGGNRGAVLEALVYAVVNGEGIVKVVGEVGSGKTMLCRMLQVELPENVEIVYLANPSLSSDEILHAIAFELKLPVDNSHNRLQVMHALQEYLLARHSENVRVVMFVEEAQGMPVATLEEIRLLSNLETRQDKLLQIVLFGQPELDENLAVKNIRQLKERITYSFDLKPFNPEQTRDYINTRLRNCGYKTMELFTPAAIRAVHKYSNGLLRRVNILADKSMLSAFASNSTHVTDKHVRVAARDSEFECARGGPRPWLVAAAAILAVVVVGLGFWQSLLQPRIVQAARTEPAIGQNIQPVTPVAPLVQVAEPEEQEEQSVPSSPTVVEPAAEVDVPELSVRVEVNPDGMGVNEVDVLYPEEDRGHLFTGQVARPDLDTLINSSSIGQMSQILSSP